MKKILFIAPASNYHTKKWCSYFVAHDYEVHVISFTEGEIKDVAVYCLMSTNKSNKSDFHKLSYLRLVSKINAIYDRLRPDIVSVHYATSYGLLAALSHIDKYTLSVWGTDIYAFPKKSFLHKKVLQFSLRKAALLMSTSKSMAKECKLYTDKDIYITPFGVDMDFFCPINKSPNETFVISNIKSLSPEYGIDVLLMAIKNVVERYPAIKLLVYIAGEGPCEHELKQLAVKLKIDTYIKWMGLVPSDVVARILKNSDIAVIPSYRESFGVSAVEAQACGIPVIISDVEGLKEATDPQKSSIVVEVGNYITLADAIIDLYFDNVKRTNMGLYAREFVYKHFEISKCFRYIETLLNNL